MKELSQIRKSIYIAYEKGYRVTETGELYGLKGKRLVVKRRGKQRYPTFSVNVGKLTKSGVFGIPVHRFAGFCFYGDRIFEEELVLRHLNGDTEDVSKTNLVLGTHSQNNLDKPAEVRRRAAILARAAQGRPMNSRFTDEEVREILRRLESGESAPRIAEEYGVTRNCIYLIRDRRNYADVI